MDEAPLEFDVSVTTRTFDPRLDEAFIYSTWRNGVYYGSRELKAQDPKTVFKRLTFEIKQILRKAHVRIACLDDSPDIIIGYVVYTGPHLDWVYVKDDFRNKGIATLLVPKNITTYTNQRTKIGEAILKKKQEERTSNASKEEE